MDVKKIVLRIGRLFFGLFLFSLGIIMTINANLGLQPWDVFHQGMSKNLNITIGQANIMVGATLIIVNSLLKEKLGWGTLANMLFVGYFMDLILLYNLVPKFDNYILRFMMMCGGMFVLGVASYYYIGTGLGAGPRDGLMVVITKKTKKSVGLVRNCIEITILILGIILGGFFGWGTIFTAVTIGFFIQFAFKVFKFDVTTVEHRFIDEDIRWLKQRFISKSAKQTESD